MHGDMHEADILTRVGGFLACYYLLAALANSLAARHWWVSAGDEQRAPRRAWRILWWVAAALFGALSVAAWTADPRWWRLLSLPAGLRDASDRALSPAVLLIGSAVGLAVFYAGRRFFTRPAVGWLGLNAAWLWLGLSLTDVDFLAIVAKPDNVPIVGLVFLLGYFTWLSARRAVVNDARRARHLPPIEAEDNEQVLVWPDLVYIELICMVALTALLLVWSLLLPAPLEQPASTVQTPNPSKAPWYFLGLQELLVYFDPWMAGVVLPALIIFGLMAIPYLDRNAQGNGYYTIDQRKFAYLTFQFGFLVLWIAVMMLGTFFRGPNWSFFGLYEPWDVHKVEALHNVTLAERFWTDLLGRPLPAAPAGSGGVRQLGLSLLREWLGLMLLGGYFLGLPPLLARTNRAAGRLLRDVGRGRYVITVFLLLTMLLLPIKMLCRWLFNLNYFVAMPEYFFNF